MAISQINNGEQGSVVRTKLNTVIGAVNGTETGSYTGSFTGDGSGLSNIPPSGIVGGISAFQIASGSATASIAPGNFNVNTNTTITGSLTVSGSTELSGSLDLNLSESGSVFSISEGSDITFDVDEFEMTGSMSVTGSLDVNGDLTVTGSANYSLPESGSFVIEDSSDIEFDVDTFVMTGSMDVSGSITTETITVTQTFLLPTSQSVSPGTGSMYFSGSFIYVYDGTQYRSASLS